MSLFETRAMVGLREPLRDLAERGMRIGTSSWKYPGWLGQIYDRARYETRGRFSKRRFEEFCLEEYAEVFPTVCVDAAYYTFPSQSFITGLCNQVSENFLFAFKVTEAITVKTHPRLKRLGAAAGKPNEHFLDAELFKSAFLRPLEPHRDRVGLLIFEFSQFHPGDFARGRHFVECLDAFLGKLPRGFPIGIEVRNRSLLEPEYFKMLSNHSVAHVFNSWTRMPSLAEQIAMPGSFTTDFFAARLLLRPGRTYREAVEAFAPYSEIRDPCPDVRAAARELLRKGVQTRATAARRPSFLFVNNRLEGSALATIAAIITEEAST